MGKNTDQQTIKPVAQSTSIAIPINNNKEFKNAFHKKSVYDFYVYSKSVKDNFIIFEVRSMRVNEFLDLLEDFNIPWSHINYKY